MKHTLKIALLLLVILSLLALCGCGEGDPADAGCQHAEEKLAGKEVTCTEDGLTEGSKCTLCGEILKAQETIAAPGHTKETVPGYAATKTEPGLTDGEKCSVCGKVLKAQEEIPATGLWNGSTAKEFAGGSGTEADPYLIANGSQLSFLSSSCTTFDPTAYSDKYYKLTDDIDLGGREWIPIAYFHGVLDGNGHTVSNFKITDSELVYAGLVGRNRGTIQNLRVVDFTIHGTKKLLNAGGIAGCSIDDSTIYNCYAEGTIHAQTTERNKNLCAGGIAGYADTMLISGCGSNVKINCVIGKLDGGGHNGRIYAGGITGYVRGIGTPAVITHCYALGQITADGYVETSVGGIAGYLYDPNIRIANCYSASDITATSTLPCRVGGIVGYAQLPSSAATKSTEIIRCISFGNLHAEVKNNNTYVGDIVGDKGKAVITTLCYHYAGQKRTAESERERVFNVLGGECSLDMSNEASLYTGILQFTPDIWDCTNLDIANGKFPTLINLPAEP